MIPAGRGPSPRALPFPRSPRRNAPLRSTQGKRAVKAAGVSSLLDQLHATFGFSAFRGVQAQVIDRVMAGERTLAVMPTGAGKSLCYQLPSVVFEGTCVVISPLIALMHDQVRAEVALDGAVGQAKNGVGGAVRLIRTSLCLPPNTRTYAEQRRRHSARAAARFSLKFWRE